MSQDDKQQRALEQFELEEFKRWVQKEEPKIFAEIEALGARIQNPDLAWKITKRMEEVGLDEKTVLSFLALRAQEIGGLRVLWRRRAEQDPAWKKRADRQLTKLHREQQEILTECSSADQRAFFIRKVWEGAKEAEKYLE